MEKIEKKKQDKFVQKKLAEYATDESDDEGLNAHVTSQADYLFKHMRDVWQMVLNMQK